jgi:hypothetical protein
MSSYTLNPWQPEHDKVNLAVLGKACEELTECATAVSRCIIQGIDESEPVTGKLNREWLTEEIADAYATLDLMCAHFGLDGSIINTRITKKLKHLQSWHRLIKNE